LRRHKENTNSAIDVEVHSQDDIDEFTSDIVVEETNAGSDTNENVNTVENYRDDNEDCKVSTVHLNKILMDMKQQQKKKMLA